MGRYRTGFMVAIATLCMAMLSCGKESPQDKDYRAVWEGSYDYSGQTISWSPRGSNPTRYFSGSLTVEAVGDSNVRIQLCDSTAEVIAFKVDADGYLTQTGGRRYTVCYGQFFSEQDSLFLHCGISSPASGNYRDFFCKKNGYGN